MRCQHAQDTSRKWKCLKYLQLHLQANRRFGGGGRESEKSGFGRVGNDMNGAGVGWMKEEKYHDENRMQKSCIGKRRILIHV